MKIKLFLLLTLLSHNSLFSQNNISTVIDEYRIGAWAMKQHNSICLKFYNGIKTGGLAVSDASFKTLGKTKALSYFQETSIVLGNEPLKPDTFYTFKTENFRSLILENKYVGVTSPKGKIIYLSKPEFYKTLNEEEIFYLENFTQKNKINFDRLHIFSKELTVNINKKLFNESLSDASQLYRTDSLASIMSPSEKASRGMVEQIVFLQIDPNDATVGYDTVITYPLDITDTSEFQGIYMALSFEGQTIKPIGISSGYHPRFSNAFMPKIFLPIGFLAYDKITSLTAADKKLLLYVLNMTIREKLSPGQYDFNLYMDTFDLDEED